MSVSHLRQSPYIDDFKLWIRHHFKEETARIIIHQLLNSVYIRKVA